jgi:tetratricopeptide (TPR) repeat protein
MIDDSSTADEHDSAPGAFAQPAGNGPVAPAGEPYDWFRRGTELLDQGNSAAAAELLAWAAKAEPQALSIREALARAYYDSRRFEESAAEFRVIVEMAPDDDYAHFGLGLSLWRMRQFPDAAEHLAVAAAMRPDRAAYGRALRQVRATLAAREDAGLSPIGSPDESAEFPPMTS